MKTSTINVKTDPKLKAKASKLAKDIGLNLSQVITISLTNFVEVGGITAGKSLEPTPYLGGIIARAKKDYEAGKNISGSFETASEIEQHLKSLK